MEGLTIREGWIPRSGSTQRGSGKDVCGPNMGKSKKKAAAAILNALLGVGTGTEVVKRLLEFEYRMLRNQSNELPLSRGVYRSER
jgi:hypothetical protein